MARLSYFIVRLFNGNEFMLIGYDKKDIIFDLWKLGLSKNQVKSIKKLKE